MALAALASVGCQGGSASNNDDGSPSAAGRGVPPINPPAYGSDVDAGGARGSPDGTAGTGASGDAARGGAAENASTASQAGTEPSGEAGGPAIATSGAAGLAGAAGSAAGEGGSSVTCSDTVSQPPFSGAPYGACRSVDDCGAFGLIKCCESSGGCWPASACPIPPTMCPTDPAECATDADCPPDGTCVVTVTGCPQCAHAECQFPPPLCAEAPEMCGDVARCQPDGTCAPIPCDEGFECSIAHQRCVVDSPRANEHGCELVPCDDGWECEPNTRCTTPTDPSTHGCTALECEFDGDCDCGYCVNGHCASNLGVCTPAPQ